MIHFPDPSRRLSPDDRAEIAQFAAGLRDAQLEFKQGDGHDLAVWRMAGEELCLFRHKGSVLINSFGAGGPITTGPTVAAALATLKQRLTA